MSLFGTPEVVKVKDLEAIKELESAHKIKIQEMEAKHKLEIQQKDFDIKHYKDEEMSKMRDQVVKLEQELAVVKNENKMLEEVVDLNSDIIDIKKLVSSLIEKLPTINLSSLTVQSKG